MAARDARPAPALLVLLCFLLTFCYEPTPNSVLPTASHALPDIEPELLVASFTTDGHVAYCNEAWRSVLGPTKTPWMRLGEDDRSQAIEAVTRAASGSLETNQLVNARTSARDEPLPVLLHFMPVHEAADDSPSVTAVTVAGEVLAEPPSWTTDQTERHRLEAVGRMTMGIVHDLNNLLSGLFGHIELLQQTAAVDALDDQATTSLRTIENVAEDGASLIEKLQRFIRQDRQQHFTPLDPVELLDDCIAMTQPYWYNEPRRQGIAIEVERDFGSVPAVSGDASELREVIVNLILNAVQAMPEGGTLTIRAAAPDSSTVRLEVHDTGEGMSAEIQRRIFEPLFTTKGEHGTGMGLAVSYGIIQKHEGAIRVDSTPGEGTCFTITLPAASGKVQADEDRAGAPADVEPAHVMIVDDEEMVRSIFTKLLSLNGHEVTRAASGPEALDLIDQEPPDILFTDLGMSEMNGAELAQTIRAERPALPIVLVTGDTDLEAASQHVDAIVEKPFKLDELEQLIRQHVR